MVRDLLQAWRGGDDAATGVRGRHGSWPEADGDGGWVDRHGITITCRGALYEDDDPYDDDYTDDYNDPYDDYADSYGDSYRNWRQDIGARPAACASL